MSDVLHRTNVRKVIANARADYFPCSGTTIVRKSYLEALDREIVKLIRRHVKTNGPTRSLTDDVVIHCSS